MTTNNDLMVVSQEQLDAFAKVAGAEKTTGGDFLPQLKINYDDEDEDGNQLRKGLFTITGQDTTLYASSVTFRPLTQHFQWSQYDASLDKTVNRTIFIPNFKEEARDEKGTLRCGKPTAKVLKDNPALAKQYEDVTCVRHVQGLATIEGKTATGEAGKIENVPVALRLKGANFTGFEEQYFKKLDGKGKIWDHVLTLTNHKEKSGSVTFYVIDYAADFAERVPVDAATFQTMLALQERIEGTNKDIDKKYYASVHARSNDDSAINSLKSVNQALQDDLDDDIPF